MSDLFSAIRSARVFDLSQPFYVGMPHFPTHPPYLFSLNKEHGDYVMKNGGSSSAETLTLGGHVGTHIDALCHFSCGGKVFGGAALEQSHSTGVRPHSVDTIAPVVRRAVLLDVAGLRGVEALDEDYAITPEDLESCGSKIERGDIALIRTGYGRYWRDARRFTTGSKSVHVCGPGPEEPAARWLSAKGIFAAGSDTMAFERVPSSTMPVHMHLLVENGIHIIENLNLEELAQEGIKEFLLIAMPLRFEGGTGSPLRPIALV